MKAPCPLRLRHLALLALLAFSVSGIAAEPSRPRRRAQAADVEAAATAPTTFAPLPADHPLASLWNDPDFTRRLLGSYGFASDREPRLSPEEQATYRDKIVPLLREDPMKAIPELEALVKPEASALFDFTLGNIHFQNENLTNAVAHFERALGKFPDFLRAQKNLAFALVRSGRYQEAVRPLARTAALGGADSKVFGLLGFAYLNQEKWSSAEAAYKQAMLFEPENLDYKLGIVKCYLALSNYDPALALLDELLGQFPDRDNLWALQANVFIQKEQPGKAAVNLEALRRLGKATPAQLLLLGDLYLAQEARILAVGAYLEGVGKGGAQNVSRALRAAEILISQGALAEAGSLFAKIRETAGANLAKEDELRLLRLEAKLALAQGEGAKAIATLEDICARNPLDAEALLLAGDHYARQGQPEKAMFRYESAGKITGFEAEALVKQAQLKAQGRKYAEAVELLRKAQKSRPRDNVQRYLERMEQLALRAQGA